MDLNWAKKYISIYVYFYVYVYVYISTYFYTIVKICHKVIPSLSIQIQDYRVFTYLSSTICIFSPMPRIPVLKTLTVIKIRVLCNYSLAHSFKIIVQYYTNTTITEKCLISFSSVSLAFFLFLIFRVYSTRDAGKFPCFKVIWNNPFLCD